jgi:hypothetical protein
MTMPGADARVTGSGVSPAWTALVWSPISAGNFALTLLLCQKNPRLSSFFARRKNHTPLTVRLFGKKLLTLC